MMFRLPRKLCTLVARAGASIPQAMTFSQRTLSRNAKAIRNVKAFVHIPGATLVSLQQLDADIVERTASHLREIAETDGHYIEAVDVQTFLTWHGAEDADVAKLFKVLDPENRGTVAADKFVISLAILNTAPWNQKVDILFKAFDSNQDGVLQRSEIKDAMVTLFKVGAALSPNVNVGRFSKTRDTIKITAEHLTSTAFEHFDEEDNDVLDAKEFQEWMTSSHSSADTVRSMLDSLTVARHPRDAEIGLD